MAARLSGRVASIDYLQQLALVFMSLRSISTQEVGRLDLICTIYLPKDFKTPDILSGEGEGRMEVGNVACKLEPTSVISGKTGQNHC